VKTPAVVTRPILLVAVSVNQSAPSDPTDMSHGPLNAVGIVKAVTMGVTADTGEPPKGTLVDAPSAQPSSSVAKNAAAASAMGTGLLKITPQF
jgi:hypothetical protein